jgi:hypothetical protein
MIVLSVLALIPSVSVQAGTIYDLKTDWSKSTNPNGTWSYRQGNSIDSFNPSWPGDSWSTPQVAWSGSFPQVWFQSNGTEQFPHDWAKGDIITHSGNVSDFANSSVVVWTSPVDGTVNISGDTWKARNIGRSNDWALYLNNTILTGGTLASGDSHTSATPFLFQDGFGGASALEDITVHVGDEISFRLTKSANSPFGDYAGVNLTLDATAVPEPATLSLLFLGGAGLVAPLVWSRRRKSEES